jgi:polyisoprenoid-binding protein YceI
MKVHKTNPKLLFGILALSVVSSPLAHTQSAAQKLHLDPATTEVHFTLKDTLHTVHGSFHLKEGDIVFNPVSGEAHGTIAVDVNSGASGNDTRDGRMKREFLEATNFPVATFEPQHVTGFDAASKSQKISVAGVMTVHGGSHPITIEFTVNREGATVTAIGQFKIPYVDWGIKNPSIPFVKVEKEVTVDLTAKGSLNPAQ